METIDLARMKKLVLDRVQVGAKILSTIFLSNSTLEALTLVVNDPGDSNHWAEVQDEVMRRKLECHSFPSQLKTLHFHFPHDPMDPIARLGFFSTVFPKLQTLEFISYQQLNVEFLDLVRFPQLKSLVIHECLFVGRFAASMYCPELRFLELKVAVESKFVDLVFGLLNSLPSLRHLKHKFSTNWNMSANEVIYNNGLGKALENDDTTKISSILRERFGHLMVSTILN